MKDNLKKFVFLYTTDRSFVNKYVYNWGINLFTPRMNNDELRLRMVDSELVGIKSRRKIRQFNNKNIC